MRGFIDLIIMGFAGSRKPKILMMDVDVDWGMDDADVDAVSSDVTDDTDDAEGVSWQLESESWGSKPAKITQKQNLCTIVAVCN